MDRPQKTHCVRGHERTPDNVYSGGACKLCVKELSRKWRDENPGKAKENDRKKREENPEKYAEIHRNAVKRWRISNIEKSREIAKKWRENNPEKNKERMKRWRERNPCKSGEYHRKYALEITDSFLNSRGFKGVPEEIKELQRLNLTLKRELRKCKQSKQ